MKFSDREIKELIHAGILISLAFSILLSGGYKLFSFDIDFIIVFFISFFTAGTGFLLHELMHKYTAQRYGLWAEFRAFYPMLWLAVMFSFAGFIFAAPGAVVIKGLVNNERNGKISLAGPITNIILAILFLILYFIIPIKDSLILSFLDYGFKINALLAAFNMIPVMPFDGAKVIAWHKGVYFITLVVAVGLVTLSWIN